MLKIVLFVRSGFRWPLQGFTIAAGIRFLLRFLSLEHQYQFLEA